VKCLIALLMIAYFFGDLDESLAQFPPYWPGSELGDLMLDIDKDVQYVRLWYPAEDILAVTVRDTGSAHGGAYIFYYDRRMLLQKAAYRPATGYQARQLFYHLREVCHSIGPLEWECYWSGDHPGYTVRYEVTLLPIEEDKMVFYYFRDRHLNKKF